MRRAGAAAMWVWLVVAGAGVARAQEPEATDEAEAPAGEAMPPVEVPPPAATPEVAPASAPPVAADSWAAPHVIAISDDLRLSATRLTGSGLDSSFTQIQLAPAFDFFAIQNLSIGGQLAITYMTEEQGGSSTTTIQLGVFARVGYNVPIGATTSLWPRIGFGFQHSGGQLGGSSDRTATKVPLQVFIPFVFQPATHFFFGIGPILVTDLVAKENGENDTKMTTIGVQSTLGGYFRGL